MLFQKKILKYKTYILCHLYAHLNPSQKLIWMYVIIIVQIFAVIILCRHNRNYIFVFLLHYTETQLTNGTRIDVRIIITWPKIQNGRKCNFIAKSCLNLRWFPKKNTSTTFNIDKTFWDLCLNFWVRKNMFSHLFA